MVEIALPDLSSPSASTHHLLVGCQRREEEERGVRWEGGKKGEGERLVGDGWGGGSVKGSPCQIRCEGLRSVHLA